MAGGLGPPAGVRVSPRTGVAGRRRGDLGPPRAPPAEGVDGLKDEYQLQELRDSLRYHAVQGPVAHRPSTFGGMRGRIDRDDVWLGLGVASLELELSLLHGLITGATWMAARAGKQGMRPGSACPCCGAPSEGEDLML